MKEIKHEDWMQQVKKLNEGQSSLQDIVNRQVEFYENEKLKENNKESK